MKKRKALHVVANVVLVGVFLSIALAIVYGQAKPVNPREGEMTVSTDHAQVDYYQLGFFLPGATDPVQIQDIGKPTPDAAQVATFTFNSQPLAFGVDYVARVRARAGDAWSVWSEASNPFDRVPGPPSKPVIK